jgi:hypothetical protein
MSDYRKKVLVSQGTLVLVVAASIGLVLWARVRAEPFRELAFYNARLSVGMVEGDLLDLLGTPDRRIARDEADTAQLSSDRPVSDHVLRYSGKVPGWRLDAYVDPRGYVECIFWARQEPVRNGP